MLCAKIGGECPHPVTPDDKLVFVLMPFKGFDNIYDQIQLAVRDIVGKDFKCERADDEYTSFSIWCERICKNIREAKYLIVDTTGKNANVFYELGFAHSFGDKKTILITQNIKDAPFDVADLNHITYSPDDFRRLRKDIQKALSALEKGQPKAPVVKKSRDEIIRDLKSQLTAEEQRGTNIKKELYEAEERETQYKARIKELESTKGQPSVQAKNKIAQLEETIADLKAKLKTETENRETNQKETDRLSPVLKKKESKLLTFIRENVETIDSIKDKPVSTPESFCNPFEDNVEYIKIPGGTYEFSFTGKMVTVPDIYFCKYLVTNKRYCRFISYLQGKEKALEEDLPLNLYAEKLLEFSIYVKGLKKYLGENLNAWQDAFRSTLNDHVDFNEENQPVVGISWYAAHAYCFWLSCLEAKITLGDNLADVNHVASIYRLPTEEEWEWAAGGEADGSIREYPWPSDKGEPTAKLANYGENVGATTPVGSYPEGATPQGLLDMVGNAWEWMGNFYDKDQDSYALRGGSWYYIDSSLRCSARDLNNPVLGLSVVGFRVARAQSPKLEL